MDVCFFLDIYLGVELLGHMITLCLTFWGKQWSFKSINLFKLLSSRFVMHWEFECSIKFFHGPDSAYISNLLFYHSLCLPSSKGNSNPLQCSCLENSMDRRAWQATVHGVTESDTTEWLSLIQTHWPAPSSTKMPNSLVLGKLDMHMQKNKIRPYSHHIQK